MLLTTNPRISSGLVEFKYSEGSFVPISSDINTILVYEKKGTSIYQESEEDQSQISKECEEEGIIFI